MSDQTPREPAPEPHPTVRNVMQVDEEGLPEHSRRDPDRGMPERPDEDALEQATERERVEAGVADYAPDEVPPATDPDPEGTSEEARQAERGLGGGEVHDYTADGHTDQQLVEEMERGEES